MPVFRNSSLRLITRLRLSCRLYSERIVTSCQFCKILLHTFQHCGGRCYTPFGLDCGGRLQQWCFYCIVLPTGEPEETLPLNVTCRVAETSVWHKRFYRTDHARITRDSDTGCVLTAWAEKWLFQLIKHKRNGGNL